MAKEYGPLSQFIGRVGRDPETKETRAGEIVTFSVAVDETYDKDAKPKWVNVAVWNAELQEKVLEEVYKGAVVAVEGPLKEGTLDNGTETLDLSAFRVGLVAWIRTKKAEITKPAAKKPVKADDDF